MKIVCDSCGAKYSIADEKVAGKVFKIRCKKCSNTIVVRGDAPEHDDEEATRVFDHGSEAVWHVVVDGQQQGAYAPVQIAGLLNMSRIDWDAYVWKEGFDGWLPLREVEELVTAIGGEGPPAAQPPAGEAGAAAASASASASGEPADGAAPSEPSPDDDPFASAGGEFAGSGDAASAEPESKDLFGSSEGEADPFGGAPAASPFGESGDDVVSSPAPAASGGPKVSEGEAMTGARNENSVLFSLSNLQALAGPGSSSSGTPSAASASRPAAAQAGAAQGDASGLIDIRNLASANAAVSSGSSSPESAEGAVDDLLSVGTGASFGSSVGSGSAFGGSSALGGSSLLGGGATEEPAAPAPAAAPPQKSSKLVPILGGVAVLALGAAVVFLLMREPQQVIVERTVEVPGQAPTPAAAAPAADDSEKEPEADEASEDEVAENDEADDEKSADKPSTSTQRTTRTKSPSRTRTASKSTSSMTSTSTMKSTSRSGSSSGSKDIGSLLDQAVGGSGSKSSKSSSSGSSSNLPDTPSRSAVGSALGRVAGTARVCGNGTTGTARASVTFSGSTGRVSRVDVSGVPDAVGKCVERAVKGAKVPPFKQSSFNVTYPYRVQ